MLEDRNWQCYGPNFLLAGGDHHLAQALPHVGQAGRQSQNCHDLTEWGVALVFLLFSIYLYIHNKWQKTSPGYSDVELGFPE